MNRLVVKVKNGEDFRRYSFEDRPSYEEFCKTILIGSGSFVIKYVDEEQDLITLSNERELEEAWKFAILESKSILRITLSPKPVITEAASTPGQCHFGHQRHFNHQRNHQKVIHPAICDSCNQQIAGTRFKCINCPDYDLCEACIPNRSAVHDSTHNFVQINFPFHHGFRPHHLGRPGPRFTVVCDGCRNTITEDRFKCKNCPNYDLCSTCQAKKNDIHDPNHEFEHSNIQHAFRRPGCGRWRGRCQQQQEQQQQVPGCGRWRGRCQRMNTEACQQQQEQQQQHQVPEEKKEAQEIVQTEVKEEKVEEKQEEQVKEVEVVVNVEQVVEEEQVKQEEPTPLQQEEEMLRTLESMGFGNREVNRFLLQRTGNDLQAAVTQLLGN